MSFLCFRKLLFRLFVKPLFLIIQQSSCKTFFDEAYTLSALKLELADKESETYFILMSGKAAGFLKVNWGSSQTEQVLEDAFEIQRLYILKAYQGQGLGKQLFEFALERAQISGLVMGLAGLVWKEC